jgi:hypothetical protein
MPEASVRRTETRADYNEAAIALVRSTRLRVALFSYELDRIAFGTEAFAEAVREFLLTHRRAYMRVLVVDPMPAVRGGHHLIALGRRLSSRMEFRQFPADREPWPADFLAADDHGLLQRLTMDGLDARVYDNSRVAVRRVAGEYDRAWENAERVTEYLELGI